MSSNTADRQVFGKPASSVCCKAKQMHSISGPAQAWHMMFKSQLTHCAILQPNVAVAYATMQAT
jgi:hypothetical protein